MTFLKNKSGSVSMMFGILMPTLGLTAVASIDYGNAVSARAAAQRALDATVLSCASTGTCNKAFIENLFTKSEIITSSEVDTEYSPSTGIATGTATINVKSIILNGAAALISNPSNSPMTVQVRSAAKGPLNAGGEEKEVDLSEHEVHFVIDASESMTQHLDNVKANASTFIETLYDNGTPWMSIIPHGATVRFPRGQGFEDYLDLSSCPDGQNCTDTSQWSGCFELPSLEEIGKVKPARKYSMRVFPDQAFVQGKRDTSRCPSPSNEAMFFSTNKDDLIAKINGLDLSNGTGTERALHWAYRAAKSNKNSPYRNGVKRKGKKKVKTRSIILFSDGKPQGGGDITKQRQSNPQLLFDTFHKVCDAISEDPDVELYVTFYTGNDVDEYAAQLLKDCAPNASNFWLSDRSTFEENLEAIFGKIADNALEESGGGANRVRLIAFPEDPAK